jgi:hypothetical protein
MVFFVAASTANLAGSTFEGNDGNLVVNTSGNTDWANFIAPIAVNISNCGTINIHHVRKLQRH